ncbi:hypothetical protein GVX82_01560 [Patescibacteria group bacterium]|jgi:hypothetical protein|nr:hypothetical protein [Patescibacteria group bacterium]
MNDGSIIDLDAVNLTAEAVAAYQQLAERVGAALAQLGISPEEIPDEQGRLMTDGSLEVFVTLPGGHGEISMTIPPEHWAWRQ